jgi:hypothetical protein
MTNYPHPGVIRPVRLLAGPIPPEIQELLLQMHVEHDRQATSERDAAPTRPSHAGWPTFGSPDVTR